MRTIDAQELNAMRDLGEDIVLIDTLPEEHYAKEHIPGAENVPTDSPTFIKRVDDLVNSRDDRVVVYCANHDCDLSPRAAQKLEKEGFSNVIDFEGGIEQWKQAGFEVTGHSVASR